MFKIDKYLNYLESYYFIISFMNRSRKVIVADYFTTMETMRRLSIGSHGMFQHCKTSFTRAQLGVLMMMRYHGLQTTTDIAEQLGISSSATTQIVNGLVKSRIIRRMNSPRDRRKVLLYITNHGQALLEKTKLALQERLTELLTPLTNAELEELTRLQKKMIQHLNTANLPNKHSSRSTL